MTFEWWFAYLLTSIILSLSPGSGAINTMTTSINHGYRGAAASIAGLQTGLGIHIVLVGIGLGTLFSRSVLAFEVLKWAGAAYLIWLGIQQWRAAGSINLNTLAQTQNRGHLFKRAVFVNLTNPKSIVFLAAPIPTAFASFSSSSAGISGFFSATRRRARSSASSSRSASFTVPPARVLNGLPSLPSIMPNMWCSSGTESGT